MGDGVAVGAGRSSIGEAGRVSRLRPLRNTTRNAAAKPSNRAALKPRFIRDMVLPKWDVCGGWAEFNGDFAGVSMKGGWCYQSGAVWEL